MSAIDEDTSVAGLDATDEKKSGDKEGQAGKLVKLRAFNIFASRVRNSIKDENPVANGHELKRIAGQRWAQLANGFKQEFIDIAQNENDLIEKLPVDPNAPKRRKRKRIKVETKVDADSGLLQKKSGKPYQNDENTNGETGSGNEIMPDIDGKPKRKRKQKPGDAAAGKPANHTLVGNAGSGTLDGLNNAGYLVILRAGDTDMVFRGVLFDPFISNEGGPGVKSSRRNDGTLFSSSGPASSSRQIAGGAGFQSGTVSFTKGLNS